MAMDRQGLAERSNKRYGKSWPVCNTGAMSRASSLAMTETPALHVLNSREPILQPNGQFSPKSIQKDASKSL